MHEERVGRVLEKEATHSTKLLMRHGTIIKRLDVRVVLGNSTTRSYRGVSVLL